jgi:hypothetical protein
MGYKTELIWLSVALFSEELAACTVSVTKEYGGGKLLRNIRIKL